MTQGVIEQAIETALIRFGVSTSIAGGAATILTNAEFWGVLIGLLGAAAAWWGSYRRDRRERRDSVVRRQMDEARLQMDREEHDLRMREIAANPERRAVLR